MGVNDLQRRLSVSRAQIFRLFGSHGGVNAYIKRCRLECCYADLVRADPKFTRISDVDSSWKFGDSSVFSRQFRAQFGQAPSEVLGQFSGYPARIEEKLEIASLTSPSYSTYLDWLHHASYRVDNSLMHRQLDNEIHPVNPE